MFVIQKMIDDTENFLYSKLCAVLFYTVKLIIKNKRALLESNPSCIISFTIYIVL